MSRIPDGTERLRVPEVKLPLVISLPHAGVRIPPEVESICSLTLEEVIADGDGGAGEIYSFQEEVEGFVTTDVARAIVDMNRAEDDFRQDGIIKTHTCWGVPVYRSFPTEDTVNMLVDTYYRPYHGKLSALASSAARLGIDCHTMAAVGPPVGPDAGRQRPHICVSNADGTLPQKWLQGMAECLETALGVRPSINDPFLGGYIIRSHSAELPWVQLEMSRGPFLPVEEKRTRLLEAFRRFCSLF